MFWFFDGNGNFWGCDFFCRDSGGFVRVVNAFANIIFIDVGKVIYNVLN